jgi:hypothetical protein
MYIAQRSQNNQDKYVAGGLTLVIMFVTFLFMQWLALPEMKDKTDTYEEINWTRFKPKPPTITPVPDVVPTPVKPETPVKLADVPKPAAKPKPKPKPQTIAKVDLSTLDVFKKQNLTPATPVLENPSRETPKADQSASNTRIDLQKSSVLAGMNTLLSDKSAKLKLPRSGAPGRSTSTAAPRIAAASGQEVALGRKAEVSAAKTLGAPQTRQVTAGAVDIDMVTMGDLGPDFNDLSPIYYALIEWMKRNPAQFPGVIERFMEKSPGDLTSKVSFQADGRQFELYLLAKEAIAEVRISLLEGNESTYLIDRGLQENSRFLRIGSVNRTPTGSILSFGTVRKEASDQRASQFYQIFLSWWDSVK